MSVVTTSHSMSEKTPEVRPASPIASSESEAPG